jgi:hypothetical protein
VDAYVDEKSFLQKTKNQYKILKNAMTVLLSTKQEGIIKETPIIDTIKACRSLYWYNLNVKKGDYLKPTRDLFTSPGKIILIHENKNLIEKEYNFLMKAMVEGFVVENTVAVRNA